jgi:drug/metabolite transporter (DMT)-like permease
VTTSQLAAMALAVGGGLLYHLSQKSVPTGAGPLAILFHAYLIAAVLCLGLALLTADTPQRRELLHPHGISFALGLAVLIIEAGILFVYRSGWPIGRAALVMSVLITALLLPVGFFVYQERISSAQLAGLVLCLVGLGLLCR